MMPASPRWCSTSLRVLTGLALSALASAPAHAGLFGARLPHASPAAEQALQTGVKNATDIISQPVRDVGLMDADIPDVLVRASKDPYEFAVPPTCDQIKSEIEELTASLGPDFNLTTDERENRMSNLAIAGGRSIVNSIIPFRTLVRELSGAGPAQRRYEEALNVGFARRGFLKGVYKIQACQPVF